MIQYSLVYKEDGFLAQFLGAVFAMATGGEPLTCSLECPTPDCTLGTDGARYKTPELEAALAMQMLVMHKDRCYDTTRTDTTRTGRNPDRHNPDRT